MGKTPSTSTLEAVAYIRDNPDQFRYKIFKQAHPASDVSNNQWARLRYEVLQRPDKDRRYADRPEQVAVPEFTADKKQGGISWRKWVQWMKDGQELQSEASWSQDTAQVTVEDTDGPILILPFSDTHMGSWASDVDLFETITDEILQTPNVYVLLLGDLVEMAIKLRGVGEVTNQIMRPDQQLEFIEDWLDEIGPRVLAATWDNHAIMREENGTGWSQMKALLKRRFVYHDGIGHLDVTVGSQTYKLALTHKFRGSSYMNRTHGPARYMRFEGSDREIAIQGDIHTPGISQYYDGPIKRLAITCGTLHTRSLYGRRHFSLFTMPAFPCVELYPKEHRMIGYWSLADWKAARGMEQAA